MKTPYLLILTAVAVLFAACHKKERQAPATPEIEVAVPVTDSVVAHQSFLGEITADDKADVVARVNGTLLRKCYNDGDYVRKGQTLFVIESTSYRNAVTQAQAQLESARSRQAYYARQHEAMKKAYASDAVSQMNVIEAENNLRQATADISSAEAALSDARTQLGYCNVTAPISGRATAALVDVGNYVNGNAATVLCSIVNNGDLKVTLNVDDVTFASLVPEGITKGGPLFTAVPLQFREPLKNKYYTDLYYNAPTVSTSTGTITLEGKVYNRTGELRDGMYATVLLPLGYNAHAILVRDASIGTDQLGKYLYTVTDSNTVKYTHIEVGETINDTLRVVTKGLRPGTRYVTKALLTVRNGMKIKPVLVK